MSEHHEDEVLLLRLLRPIFRPEVLQGVHILKTISQANAEGYIVELVLLAAAVADAPSSPKTKTRSNNHITVRSTPEESTTTTALCRRQRVFVKHVDVNRYRATKRNWNDLRRTLLYARTEARFYRDFAPWLLKQQREEKQVNINAILPKCYAAEYDLTDWIDETERAVDTEDDVSSANPPVQFALDQQQSPTNQDSTHRRGLIVLECIDDESYHQDSPISLELAEDCLRSVAILHVAAWEEVAALELAVQQLAKASFHLDTRNPSELHGMVAAWEHFTTEFRTELEAASLWTDSVQQLGDRVAHAARYVSDQVSPAPTDSYATLAHGDYKAMNVFLPTQANNKTKDAEETRTGKNASAGAIIVDYASVGIGLGMSDVAMHVHHAVLPEHLSHGGEERLVRHYWQTLTASLPASKTYPWDVAWRHYQLAVVDYFRFFLGRFWRSATVESMKKMAGSKNTSLLNRNVTAAMEFIRRVDKYMVFVETERRTSLPL
jgi:Ecdysteroid kinase-like family